MKYIIRVSVFLFLLLPSIGNSQNWETYSKDNYNIDYPNNWDLDDSGTMGSKFFIFSRLVSVADDFKENVNLITQDLSAYNVNLDQFVNMSTDQVVAMIKEGNIISSDRLSKNGVEQHMLVYTGRQNDHILRFEQRFWIIDKIAYILTFTSKLDDYSQYQEVGTKIIESFEMR